MSASPNYSEAPSQTGEMSEENLMPYQYKREPLNNDEANKLYNSCNTFREKFVIWIFLDIGWQDINKRQHVFRKIIPYYTLKRAFKILRRAFCTCWDLLTYGRNMCSVMIFDLSGLLNFSNS